MFNSVVAGWIIFVPSFVMGLLLFANFLFSPWTKRRFEIAHAAIMLVCFILAAIGAGMVWA